MLEHEIQKLTAAIETMTAVIREHGKSVAAFIPNVPNNVPNNVPETLTPGATREGLKEISLQIVRADTSKKKDILAILEAHGARTITNLGFAQIRAVHGKFMALAHQIAREAQA